ncbi:Uncharacterized protein FWK35_00026375 [Aphis craccivora]|uniref:Uncharacterized protein n=1 Tax=Aphis craccivora TaxID=307492 RepID=A0A6G0VRH4_APHCR|nr:Uncharacterized protein FWK35_00026375 [Aphis craccivora]
MTAVLCNKCSPFPPSSCSVRRRRAAVARRPSPPALSSRPPVWPRRQHCTPRIYCIIPKNDDPDLPHQRQKTPPPTSTTAAAGSPLNTNYSFLTALHLPGQLRDTRTDNDLR